MNKELSHFSNLVDVIRAQATAVPQRPAFTFLSYRSRSAPPEQTGITIGQLDTRARVLAAHLQRTVRRGERVVLLFRPGMEFIAALLGCFYAGVVAVPSSLPRFGQGSARLRRIIDDSSATLVLSSASVKQDMDGEMGDLALEWLLTDDIDSADACTWTEPTVAATDLALLQYSSGSTDLPKGIMLTHGNLMHQSGVIRAQSSTNDDSTVVSWLPAFHDMGLVFGILQPLYSGQHGVLMAPEAFIQRPARWLQAISAYRAAYSVAPDFAFELCTRAIGADELDGVDLSCWEHAGNAAEPVRAGTIERFAARFAGHGFARTAFLPMYGLAEATLLVAARGPALRITDFDQNALEQNLAVAAGVDAVAVRRMVSCGRPVGGSDVRIVVPDTTTPIMQTAVGEILVASDSVGQGYFGNATTTATSFQGRVDGSDRHYLRTGDLGFFYDDELYICGRIKDLILIRGANHHAPDIESTVESCHSAIRPASGAAFSVDIEDQERLVVVYELARGGAVIGEEELAQIASTIRQRIAESHNIATHAIVLMQRGVPKTSSGKVQRLASRAKYLAGQFNALYMWQAGSAATSGESTAPSPAAVPVDAGGPVRQWLLARFCTLLGCDADDALAARPFAELAPGADVLATLRCAAQAEFAVLLVPAIFEEVDSIDSLARHIVHIQKHGASGQGLRAEQLNFSAERREGGMLGQPIAIVGIGCRFPGANGPQQFWDNLRNGVDSIEEVPADRWDVNATYDANPLAIGKMNVRQGGFLKDIENFDRHFFECSIREATRMDPAHRLMSEVSWEALEDAGILPEAIAESRTGVFVGISGSDYAHLQFGDETMADAYAGLGSALTNAASRVSHFLNLRGPALAVDTACSSSLSAIHIACNSIRQGECDMALAGGVNIVISPSITMSLCKAGMMAPDGRCKAFDSRADGYVRSEGAGLVLLKPLAKALADGNPIYAVIRGSASNHDGRSSALAAPNGEAQQRVVMAACQDAGVLPGQLNYVEAHGTGTPVGDPIEVNALGEVLRIGAVDGTSCAIGSVKTNIGHTESAAGVAGMIKAALMLKHRQLVPSLHFIEANPKIPFDTLRVKVQTTLADLSELERPALIGVNSFGIGGTNVHLVLEEHRATPLPPAAVPADGQLFILPVSANNANSLKANAQAMAEFLLDAITVTTLGDVCHTQIHHRSQMDHRLAVVGCDKTELIDALEAFASVNQQAEVLTGRVKKDADGGHTLAFVFSGHGSHWWAMGRELFESEPVYRAKFEQCDRLLQPHTGWSLIDLILREDGENLLSDTGYAQPAIFALQCSLVALWDAWGIRPDAVVGHSVGEIAAAYAAGALTLEDAVKLVATRARLMSQAPAGAMASIDITADELAVRLEPYADTLSIAAINGPRSVVVSGNGDALNALLSELAAENIAAVKMKVNYAFHSSYMDPFKDALVAEVAAIRPIAARIPFASTVSGNWSGSDQLLDAAYWGDNLREKVMLRSAIETVARSGITTFLEIGPHPVFAGNIAKTLLGIGVQGAVVSSLNRRVPEARAMRGAFAGLYVNGKVGDWSALQPTGRQCQGLPAYRWDRQRYWLDDAHQRARDRLSLYPLLTTRLPLAEPAWQSQLDHQAIPYLNALRVKGRARFPNGVLVELALEAAQEQGCASLATELVELSFAEPCNMDSDSGVCSFQTIALLESDGRRIVRIKSEAVHAIAGEAAWKPMLSASIRFQTAPAFQGAEPMDIEFLKSRIRDPLDGALAYQKFAELGVQYEAALQLASQVWLGDTETLVALQLNTRIGAAAHPFKLHPLVFEAIEQAARMAAGPGAARHVLAGLERLCLIAGADAARYAHVRLRTGAASVTTVTADVWLLDQDGRVLVSAEGLVLAAADDEKGSDIRISDDPAEWRYQYEWEAKALVAPQEGATANGRWLVLADHSGTARSIAALLSAKGADVVLAYPGQSFVKVSELEYTIRVDHPDDLARLVDSAVSADGKSCRGLLHMCGLDAVGVDAIVHPGSDLDQGLTAISLALLVQVVTKAALAGRPRLWVVSGGAQPAGAAVAALEVAQSSMWGLGKGIAIEHPELRCCRIDLGRDGDQVEIQALCAELLADGLDDQIALRGDERFVARLTQQANKVGAFDDAELTLAQAAAGDAYKVVLDRAEPPVGSLLTSRRRAPGTDEVEIRVDIAIIPGGAIDAYLQAPARARHAIVTDQSTGRVVRVGPGVTRFAVGDRVLALHTECIRSHVIVPTAALIALEGLKAERLSGAVKPYLAASFGLATLAGVKRTSNVFVHGADGCLGQAVVQVARSMGAKIFISGVSVKTLEQADDQGVTHAFDLADPAFIDQLRGLCGAKGIDVFVNCVPGYDLGRCTVVLSAYGRCLDMAACDSAAPGDARQLRLPGNAILQSVDLASLLRDDATTAESLLAEVVSKLDSGVFRALPQDSLDFEALASALHGGRPRQLAIRLPQPNDASIDEIRAPFKSEAAYLITGGLGGLGLSIAKRMAQRGARYLVLAGRRSPNLEALDAIAEMERLGVHCLTVALDVADGQQVRQLLDRIGSELPPLRGIIHAAGVLDNGLLIQLEPKQFNTVAKAKVDGAWNLHAQLGDTEIDFFVLFSSLASAIGSPGQSNYSAANAFLDALAEHRRCEGKPGLSIGWGPWSEVGMASGVHTLERLAEHGMGMVPLTVGLNLLEELISEGRQGAMAVLPMNWARWGAAFPLAGVLPYFEQLVPKIGEASSQREARITAEILLKMGDDAQIEVLQETVRRAVCQTMRIAVDGLDVNTPLTAAGLDSILALELKSRIEMGIDVVVQTYSLLKGQSVRGLALQFRTLMMSAPTALAAVAPVEHTALATEDATALLGRIGEMNEDEVAALLRDLTQDETP